MLSRESILPGFTAAMIQEPCALVLRNQETFHPDNGISWYEGKTKGDFDKVFSEIWLPKHSLALINALDTHGAVTLTGTVGSGKSTLLYGARALMRAEGVPYVNINGHYTNTNAEEVTRTIDGAQAHQIPVIFDSADYLASKHKRTRALSLGRHIPRSIAILEKLIAFRQKEGSLLLTSHHEDWLKDRSHPDLLPLWNDLVSRTTRVDINISLPEESERTKLLMKMGIEANIAAYISQLPENPQFVNYILNRWGDFQYIQWAKQQLSSYSILKLLSRDDYKENTQVLDMIRKSVSDDQNQQASWDAILDFVFSKTYRLLFFTKDT